MIQEEEGQSSSSVFHATLEELKKESQAALERSAQKSQQIRDLQREKSQLEEALTHRWTGGVINTVINQVLLINIQQKQFTMNTL